MSVCLHVADSCCVVFWGHHSRQYQRPAAGGDRTPVLEEVCATSDRRSSETWPYGVLVSVARGGGEMAGWEARVVMREAEARAGVLPRRGNGKGCTPSCVWPHC